MLGLNTSKSAGSGNFLPVHWSCRRAPLVPPPRLRWQRRRRQPPPPHGAWCAVWRASCRAAPPERLQVTVRAAVLRCLTAEAPAEPSCCMSTKWGSSCWQPARQAALAAPGWALTRVATSREGPCAAARHAVSALHGSTSNPHGAEGAQRPGAPCLLPEVAGTGKQGHRQCGTDCPAPLV